MKIVNTQCSIIIVAVVVLRWLAFTLSYLLSPLLPPPASLYYHNGDWRTNRIHNWGGAFLLQPYSILDWRPHSNAHASKCADCHYICCWLWNSSGRQDIDSIQCAHNRLSLYNLEAQWNCNHLEFVAVGHHLPLPLSVCIHIHPSFLQTLKSSEWKDFCVPL